MAEAIFLDTSDMEASLRKISEAREKQVRVSSKAGWCGEREGGRSTQFVVAISINAANENVGYPGDTSIGYVFKHGCDGDVALFAGCQICREVRERPV